VIQVPATATIAAGSSGTSSFNLQAVGTGSSTLTASSSGWDNKTSGIIQVQGTMGSRISLPDTYEEINNLVLEPLPIVANNVMLQPEPVMVWSLFLSSVPMNQIANLGGVLISAGGSTRSPIIAYNVIFNNTAGNGGGIACYNSSPTIIGNLIIGNYADEIGGGAIYIVGSSSNPIIKSNTICLNDANSGNGGGIYVDTGAAAAIDNCILWNNQDDLWNCTATYSCVTQLSSDPGVGNISADPVFVQTTDPNLAGYYRLNVTGSSCVNKGNSAYLPEAGETDIDGEPRITNGRVDIGADETPDATAPNTQILTAPQEGGYVCSLPVNFTWTGTDDITPLGQLRYSWRIDSGNWSGWSSDTNQSFSELTDGQHSFEAKAKDQAGTEDQSPAIRHFTVDTSGNLPLISNVSVSVGQQQVIVSWTTDKPATSQVEYGLTDAYGLLTPLDSRLLTGHSVTISGLTPENTYYYRVKSKSGCDYESISSGASFTTAADTTPPETSIISGPSNGGIACESIVEFCWSGSDNFTPANQLVYSYRIDSSGWSGWVASTCNSFTLADGQHTVEVKAKDGFGNEDQSPAIRHFTVDASGSPPQISNVNTSVGQQQTTITWTTDKPSTSQIEYGLTDAYGSSTLLNSQLVINHSVIITGLIPQTTYYYRVKSKDGCGRESVLSGGTFTTAADTTSPETSIISGPSNGGIACANTVEICWSGSDNFTPPNQLVYSYRIDSSGWSGWVASTCNSFTLADGQHTVEVKAKDSSGNEDSTPANRTFRVDTVYPSINSVHASPQAGSATINWNTNEACTSRVEYGLDTNYGFETSLVSNLVTAHNVTISGLEPVTTYHYRVKSRDGCGRETVSDDFPFTTTEDTAAPDTWFTSGPPNNGKTCSQTVDFCWSGSDDATPIAELQYSFKTDSGDWSTWAPESCHSFAGLSEGLHTVQVKARDKKGNVDTTPAYRNFYVDLTAPTISNISVSPRDYRATITWNTNEPATSQVEYGVTAGYGMTSSLVATMDGAHTITIRGLTPETTYHFRVKSNDGCREVVSDDQTFTTTAILPSNLSVVSFSAPTTTIALGTINVSWRVQNKGPGDATTNWLDGVYLSTDEFLDGNDIEIQTIASVMPLPEYSQYSRSVQLQMPLAPEGIYYLIVKADSGQTISETDETDNFCAQQIEFLHVKTMVISPSEIPLNLNPAIAVSGQLDIGNLSSTALSDITATVENATSNINIQIIAPPDLNSMQTGKINYTVIASDESILQNSPTIRFTSDEGEEVTISFNIRVIPRHPNLVVSPGYLEVGMLRGAQTLVECEISNNGAVPAYDLGVQLPAVPWMKLVTPENVGTILAGEKKKVVLSLTPPANIQLGPYTGNIAVFGSNTSLSIGFRFTAISDKVGGLRIKAEDEFTYYADGNPPVAGAKLELKDVSTGEVLVRDVTDTNGIYEMPQLLEGYYNLEVSAEKHGTYRSTVEIAGGQLKEIQAFLPRQLVTYTWNVVPVELEDRYEVTLETTFETHVPAPVITVDPMVLDVTKLTFDAEGKSVVNYTITNYGFISVKDVKIQFGTHPKYQLTPLVENIGNLNAMSSTIVPVTITDLDIIQASSHLILTAGVTSSSTSGSSNPCGVAGLTQYTYDCGGDRTGLISLTVVTGQCPSSSTPYISIGGVGVAGGGGGGGPGVTLPTFDIEVDCNNPCLPGCLSSIAGCIPVVGPGVDCTLGLAQCGINFNASNPMQILGSLLHCDAAVVNCLEDWLDPVLGCLCTIARDCVICRIYGGPEKAPWWPCSIADIIDKVIDLVIPPSSGSKVSSGFGMLIEQGVSSTIGDYFMEQYYRVGAVPATLAYILGDAKWLDTSEADKGKLQPWLETFYSMTADESEAANSISEAELSELLSLERPTQVDAADVQKFVGRWNRTVEYSGLGILSENDLPSGWDPDFIAFDKVKALYDFIVQAEQDVKGEGFDGLIDALIYARQMLAEEKMKESKGVCGRVKIQLDQQVAITRTAFKATLEIENAPENVNLENVRVVLDIRDTNSVTSNDRFGIRTPELTNINDINGGGSIVPGTTATAVWTILPTRDAAPDVQTQYYVGGTLEYDQGGTHISIPLFPAPILVKPDPLLVLDYFLVRDVYSDDPFTLQIEPAEPFSLGLLMSNRGNGIAKNVRITSSQPKIVENEKGLLIDFKITGTQVNNSQVSPSLTVNLGDIAPGDTSVAQWIMTCSLQGKFIDYNATFEHVDELGNKRLSLIDSVNIHELVHVVCVDVPANDGKPDFLVNEVPDGEHLPDTLFNSDGSTAVVNVGANTTIDGSVATGNLQVQLDSTVPSGWVYIRVSDPGMDQFRLVRVIRSDGREIIVGDNAWTTHRAIRLVGQPEYREHLLHIFDKDSTGSYTLVYEEIAPDITPPASAVLPLPPEETSSTFTVCWSGEDNTGGSGLKDFDIYVSDNGGAWQPWLSNVVIRCASFVGQAGHTYSFYSIARDVAGNVEVPPVEPDATTRTMVITPPQADFVAGYIDANTQTYRFAVTYIDSQAIDISSLNTGDISVKGPGGFQQPTTFVGVDLNNNGSPRTAYYMFTAPGGTWDPADNGLYVLQMESSQVSNTRGNFVDSGILTTFAITDNFAGELVLESYNLIKQTRIGRTVFDYVFTVTLYNSSSVAISGVDFELFNAPANMTIIDSNVTFAHIKAGETATSAGTLTVRVNRTSTTDLYSIPWRVTFEPGKLLGDFTGDGKVDLDDLRIFATYWLRRGLLAG
jgi:hypothetical protein